MKLTIVDQIEKQAARAQPEYPDDLRTVLNMWGYLDWTIYEVKVNRKSEKVFVRAQQRPRGATWVQDQTVIIPFAILNSACPKREALLVQLKRELAEKERELKEARARVEFCENRFYEIEDQIEMLKNGTFA